LPAEVVAGLATVDSLVLVKVDDTAPDVVMPILVAVVVKILVTVVATLVLGLFVVEELAAKGVVIIGFVELLEVVD